MIGLALREATQSYGRMILWCGHSHYSEQVAQACAEKTVRWANKKYEGPLFIPLAIRRFAGSR